MQRIGPAGELHLADVAQKVPYLARAFERGAREDLLERSAFLDLTDRV